MKISVYESSIMTSLHVSCHHHHSRQRQRRSFIHESDYTIRYHRRNLLCQSSISQVSDTFPSGESKVTRKNLAVFVSGGGSNFKAIHQDSRICGTVDVIVTNAPSCGGAVYAREHGIPVLVYPASDRQPEGLSPEALADALTTEYDIDLVILAGYMKLIPEVVVKAFPRAMVNIHPGLLPSFGGKGLYGTRVHSAVIASGARVSGPTVHFVDEEYDTGPILAQSVVPVYPDDCPDTLAARVLKQEHVLYPQCIAALCDDRVSWRADGIPYIWQAV